MSEMEAGRELDALIAEKVMGLQVHQLTATIWYVHARGGEPPPHVPDYSTDIAAAWEVVEKMGPAFDGLYPSYDFDPDRLMHWVAVTNHNPRLSRRGHTAPTAPLAICRAALFVAEATQ